MSNDFISSSNITREELLKPLPKPKPISEIEIGDFVTDNPSYTPRYGLSKVISINKPKILIELNSGEAIWVHQDLLKIATKPE